MADIKIKYTNTAEDYTEEIAIEVTRLEHYNVDSFIKDILNELKRGLPEIQTYSEGNENEEQHN